MSLTCLAPRRAAACVVAVAMCAASPTVRAQASPPGTGSAEPPAVLSPEPRPVVSPVVEVRQYLVVGVTLLDAKAVEAALAGRVGTRTVEELHRAAGIVQSMYADAGYGAVVVYLPPQEVSSGVVLLRAIEGRLSGVTVQGEGVAREGVLASLPALRTGTTPRLDLLDQQLRMANENPAKRTRLVLLPGARPEETEAEVAVESGPRRQVTVELDDTGSPSTGRARLGLGWRDADLTGHDDVLDLRVLVSPSRPRQFAAGSASWRWPLYPHATVLEAYALVSDARSDDVPTAAGALRFAGRGSLLGVRATHFLRRWRGWDQRVSFGLERRDQRNECGVGNLPPGACGGVAGDLVILPLVLEYTLVGDAELPVVASASLVQGVALGGRGDRADFDAVRPGARPDFTSLRAQMSLQRALDDAGWDLIARLAGQAALDPLVPAMQFGAGGRDSVRGYEEREVAADHGLAVSLEVRTPRWVDAGRGAQARALAFVDLASLRNRRGDACTGTRRRCDLAGVGVGVRLDLPAFSLGIDLARALREGGVTASGEGRAHAWLRWTP